MIFAIIAAALGIGGGILAMSSLFVGKSPGAAEKLAKLAQYQGYIGLSMFAWGVWELIDSILSLGMIGEHPLIWGFMLASGIADFGVGLILGFGLISVYAFRGNAVAIEKGNALRTSLVKFQVPLGLLAIITSTLYLVFWFV
ncbi:hypothetical protein BH09MYX1_BH09MYX1_60760 [soil metagenome]